MNNTLRQRIYIDRPGNPAGADCGFPVDGGRLWYNCCSDRHCHLGVVASVCGSGGWCLPLLRTEAGGEEKLIRRRTSVKRREGLPHGVLR